MSKRNLGLGLSICISFGGLLLSTLGAAGQAPAAPAAAAAPADGDTNLPPGDGRELVMRVCSKCHTPDFVTEQNLDGQGWRDLVNQMQNNGAQGTDAEFDKIVAYLTKNFPPQ